MLEFAPFDAESADESHVAALFSQARTEDIPMLITLRRTEIDAPATVSALVQETWSSEHWIDAAARRTLVGASAPFSGLAQVPASVREAETALSIGRSRAAVLTEPEQVGAVRIDRIDLTTWMLSHVEQRALQRYIDEVLAPLRQSALLDTLVTYLAAEQNIGLTAQALFVHPNTVRYRLSRIEEAIGTSVSAAPTIANLVLALYPEVLGRTEELRRLHGRGTRSGPFDPAHPLEPGSRLPSGAAPPLGTAQRASTVQQGSSAQPARILRTVRTVPPEPATGQADDR